MGDLIIDYSSKIIETRKLDPQVFLGNEDIDVNLFGLLTELTKII
ncbi:MAG: hypothetical protein ACTSU2_03285 [Promethearchaeota archaeon]